jgi:hypothetical protein
MFNENRSACFLFLRNLLFIAFFAGGLSGLGAVDSGPRPEPLSEGRWTIKILEFGPGDELYSWWGHIGLLVRDNLTAEERLYDWGQFSFGSEKFFTNFAMGRLLFRCGVSWAGDGIFRYLYQDRSAIAYTLDLPEQAEKVIVDFAETSVLPENRDYFYHHFRDNCATRIRDILDMAVEGAVQRAAAGDSGFTYRQAITRYSEDRFWVNWFLSFCLGREQDLPISVWAAMFLPGEVGPRLEGYTYIGPEGERRPLVLDRETLYLSESRGEIPAAPSARPRLRAAILGLGLAALFGFLRGLSQGGRGGAGRLEGRPGKLGRGAGFIGSLAGGLWGVVLGVPGTALFFMSFFTNHDYTYHNNNLLFINPLLLAALPLGIIAGINALRKNPRPGRAETLLQGLWTLILAGGLAALAINLFPSLYQDNWDSLLLVLPGAAVMSFLPRLLKEGKMKANVNPEG